MPHATPDRIPTGMAETVLGPVPADDLGITITHEHLLAHAPHVAKEPAEASARERFHAPVTIGLLSGLTYGRVVNLDNCRLTDIGTAIDEARLFRLAGGSTIVDATSIGIGRDPLGLARIARATGLNIVMGASYYIEATHPEERRVSERSEAEIADEIARDVTEGVDGTGIRAGLIGEVGCSFPITAVEKKVLRASARAQRLTGAPLMVHTARARRSPFEIVEVLKETNADLGRTILCHIDRTLDDKEDLRRLAETGCVIEYDLFGYENSYYPWDLEIDMPNDARRLRWLAWLIAEGYGDRIVISHDIIFKNKLVRYGGNGYAHIVENVVPLMRRQGFSEEDIRRILVENPRRLLAFAPPARASAGSGG